MRNRDVLARLTPHDIEVISEQTRNAPAAELLAGYMVRRALGMQVGLDRMRPMGDPKMQRNATFDDPEAALSGNQITALKSLLAGETRTKAAELAGVDRATLYRWLANDPRFVAALANRKAELVGAAVSRLCGLADEAIGVLGDLLKQTDNLPLKLKVATQILGLAGIDRQTDHHARDITSADELQAAWDEAAVEREISDCQAASDRQLRAALASFGGPGDGE